MTGPHRAVALTRLAVRHALRRTFAPVDGVPSREPRRLVVGVSGGADSLALASALLFEAPKQHVELRVVIIDHGLQEGSAEVAERARQACIDMGYAPEDVVVERVEVDTDSSEGLEAAARAARLGCLRAAASEFGASRVVLGHTGDDQAEQVFLGLLRGSGPRALAGMRTDRVGVLRPFLLGADVMRGGPVMRATTLQACEALGFEPWQDPHNADERFARVRARRALTTLENGLKTSTLRRNLVRSADAAARDADLLDKLTDDALASAAGTSDPEQWPSAWPVESLTALDPALRIRALRRLLVLHGARDAELGSQHLLDVERLLTGWQGQGPIDVPGSVEVGRNGGEVAIRPRRDGQ